jgi:sigma-B regulation protein RsbU (phosphoserine phosphatase)
VSRYDGFRVRGYDCGFKKNFPHAGARLDLTCLSLNEQWGLLETEIFMNSERRNSDKERINLALSSAGMGTWDWDVPKSVIWWDDQMHILFGLAPGTFKGGYEDFLALIHEEDRERIRDEFTNAIAARAAVDTEFRVAQPFSGSEHVLRMRSRAYRNDNVKVSRIVGVAWDITERRATELALAKERNLLKTLMDHLPYAIYFKDLESRFIAASRALAKLHGKKDPAALIGKTDHDLFSIEHADAALADEREIIRTGRPIVDYEERETWPDREDTWVSTTKMPLRDAAGHIIGTFGISRDITEKKRAAEKLAQLAEELRAKNESLEQDLEMARELQSALLPQRFPNFPHDVAEEDSAVRFYPFFRPSTTISGDFFDVLDIADDKAGLFICDVMGHGVRAALVAAIVRSVVSELRPLWTKPGELLVAINRALLEAFKNSDITLFASAFYLVADLAKGQLHYANAGHPNPLHFTRAANSSAAAALPLKGARSGPALGLFDGARYDTVHRKISPRDVVLLFTDGLFEVEGSGGQLYDYQKLLRAVCNRTGLPVPELCRSLIDEVQQFSATQAFDDDVCLVAMDIDRLKLRNGNKS